MSIQLTVLTIRMKNPHATQKNYHQIKQFLLSNYCFYNARENAERRLKFMQLCKFTRNFRQAYGVVQHKELPTVHFKYDICCHSVTCSFNTWKNIF